MSVVRVPIDNYQYLIVADGVFPDGEEEATSVADGLLEQLPGVASILTPSEGYVRVEIDRRLARPEVALDDWHDAVEWSMTSDTGDLRILPLFEQAVGPQLASSGPGAYRLMLLARDRDPIGRKAANDTHLLLVWPEPESPPRVYRLLSTFAATWNAPEPTRPKIDWSALAAQPGWRLIVGWKELKFPDDESAEPATVTVSDELPLTPSEAFNLFYCASPGHLAAGMMGRDPDGWLTGRVIHSGQLELERESQIGCLDHRSRFLELRKYSYLRFVWGFEEFPQNGESPIVPHPIPPGAITTEVSISKGASGRTITILNRDVPAWLADDIAALWQIVLDRQKQVPPEPWPWGT